MHFRISRLTYLNLGFDPKYKKKITLNTAYVLFGEKCNNSCSFCSFSKQNLTENRKMLSRVDWLVVDKNEFISRVYSSSEIKRICFQLPNNRESVEELLLLLSDTKIAKSKYVSISAWIKENDIKQFINLGVSNIALNIDIVNPKQHSIIKGGNYYKKVSFINKISKIYTKFRFTTHIIVGGGETDFEIFKFFLKMKKNNVITALFTYTKVNEIDLPGLVRPSLKRYRNIQVMKFIIDNFESGYKFVWDDFGFIKEILVNSNIMNSISSSYSIFNTSGCSLCTRPYYNDSPKQKDLFNYFSSINNCEFDKILNSINISVL